jgi:hypothetical protein
MTDYPQGVTSFGVPIIGPGPILTSGKVFWVNYTTGTDGNGRGDSPTNPFKTLDYAIGKCRSNKGDVIFLMPGHAEDIIAAGTVTMDVPGVSVIGLGQGSLRPTFTFKTATSATILISAANCRISNCIMDHTGIDAIATGINITGADAEIDHCKFVCSATDKKAVKSIVVAANNANIHHNEFASPVTTAVNCIYCGTAKDNIRITDNRAYGYWSGQFFLNDTAAVTNLYLARNHVWMLHATGILATLEATATGIIADNYTYVTKDITAGGSVVAAAAALFQNFDMELAHAGASAQLSPAAGGYA